MTVYCRNFLSYLFTYYTRISLL